MKKFFLIALMIFSLGFAAPTAAGGGSGYGVQCYTYECLLAQQEIQYLLDAIWWEKQKMYPNWEAIRQAEARIRFLSTIR